METVNARVAKDPLVEKLTGLNERLDELLLELGDLENKMPEEEDLKKLRNPNATVNLPKLHEKKGSAKQTETGEDAEQKLKSDSDLSKLSKPEDRMLDLPTVFPRS